MVGEVPPAAFGCDLIKAMGRESLEAQGEGKKERDTIHKSIFLFTVVSYKHTESLGFFVFFQ